MAAKRFFKWVIIRYKDWRELNDEVERLKRELERTQQKNTNLQAKLKAYETGCLYGGNHCEACKKSRKVSGFVSYGMGYYKENNIICTLNVPCGEFELKEATP